MKKLILGITAILLLFTTCTVCKELQTMNLPELDWDEYHDVKTLYPYFCNNKNPNPDPPIKLMGWKSARQDEFLLYDDSNVTDWSYNKPYSGTRIKIKLMAGNLKQFLDTVDVTQKCYVMGVLGGCEVFNPHFINSCNEYRPILYVPDLRFISFGKEIDVPFEPLKKEVEDED